MTHARPFGRSTNPLSFPALQLSTSKWIEVRSIFKKNEMVKHVSSPNTYGFRPSWTSTTSIRYCTLEQWSSEIPRRFRWNISNFHRDEIENPTLSAIVCVYILLCHAQTKHVTRYLTDIRKSETCRFDVIKTFPQWVQIWSPKFTQRNCKISCTKTNLFSFPTNATNLTMLRAQLDEITFVYSFITIKNVW